MIKLSIVILVMCCSHVSIVTEANECFGGNSPAVTPGEFFNLRYGPTKSDQHKALHDKIRKSPYGHDVNIRKFLDIITEEAKSKYFKDRLQSILRTVWLTSITFGEITTEKLCIISDFLTVAVMEENGLNDVRDWSCTFDEIIYTIIDYVNEISKWTLSEHGCQTTGVRKQAEPTCFNSTACVTEGRKYLFDEIWVEYDRSESELEEAGKDTNDASPLLAIAKELHSSTYFYDNYAAAVISASGVATDWMWKANVMNSELLAAALVQLGLIEEAASTTQKCDCSKLEPNISALLENFYDALNKLFDVFKASTAAIGSHGHIPGLKDRQGKSRFRN